MALYSYTNNEEEERGVFVLVGTGVRWVPHGGSFVIECDPEDHVAVQGPFNEEGESQMLHEGTAQSLASSADGVLEYGEEEE